MRYIFYFDGVIVNTKTSFYAIAQCAILKQKCNITTTPEILTTRFSNFSTRQIFEKLSGDSDPKFLDYMIQCMLEEMYRMVQKRNMDYRSDIVALLMHLYLRREDVAVVSSSPMQWMNYRRIQNLVPFVYSLEDCKKTNPNVFKEALESENFFRPSSAHQQLFIVVSEKAHVLDALDVDNARVFFVSEDNAEFDRNPRVDRVGNTTELARRINSKMMRK